MAQTQILKRRIRSVDNAKQITKAMELVAASRMRRVQAAVGRTREYAGLARIITQRVANTPEAKYHPYFRSADTAKSKLYIVFSSDRGLAGAFNSNIFNETIRALNEDSTRSERHSLVVVGRKGARFFSHFSNLNVLGEYEDMADDPEPNTLAPILETIDSKIKNSEFSNVVLIYTEFISALTQAVKRLQLLPIDPTQLSTPEEDKAPNTIFEFEPNAEAVLERALRLYLESQLLQARVEAAASEYAMRMMAMGNANRNASDLIEHLTLELNATRQAAITQEIAEITGGANALS